MKALLPPALLLPGTHANHTTAFASHSCNCYYQNRWGRNECNVTVRQEETERKEKADGSGVKKK